MPQINLSGTSTAPANLTTAGAVIEAERSVQNKRRQAFGPMPEIQVREITLVREPSRIEMLERIAELEKIPLDALLRAIANIRETPPTFKTVREAVCIEFNLSWVNILSQRRINEWVTPRKVMMCLLRNLSHASLPMIGRYMNRDHTTILYGARFYQPIYDTIAADGLHRTPQEWARAFREKLTNNLTTTGG